jgi:hypothetical protein
MSAGRGRKYASLGIPAVVLKDAIHNYEMIFVRMAGAELQSKHFGVRDNTICDCVMMSWISR